MNQNFKKILEIHYTLDTSESIMFREGGKFVATIKKEFDDDEGEYKSQLIDEMINSDEIRISFQIDGGCLGRYNNIVKEADTHRAQWNVMNEERIKENQKKWEEELKKSIQGNSKPNS